MSGRIVSSFSLTPKTPYVVHLVVRDVRDVSRDLRMLSAHSQNGIDMNFPTLPHLRLS